MQTKRHLLIVEDDDQLAGLLLEYLELQGFAVSRASTGEEGIDRILDSLPDLVILDLMLPGANGLDVCRRVRDAYSGAILMLTASQSETDHVAGLELGADDFVTKPIEPRVLLARIRAQLRRLGAGQGVPRDEDSLIDLGALRVDPAARSASVQGSPVPLTTMELDILLLLARDAGTVVKREDLYAQVMDVEYDGVDRGMDVHVSRIRRKLERVGFDPGRLKSVRGVGYLLAHR